MSTGIGGRTAEAALAGLAPMMDGVQPIGLDEYHERVVRAQRLMREHDLAALYLHAGTSLRYFTGLVWRGSERLVGALLTAAGEVEYLAPAFEEGTVRDFQVLPGAIRTWHEHESPYRLLQQRLHAYGIADDARIGLCESRRSSSSTDCAGLLRRCSWSMPNRSPPVAACASRQRRSR